MKKIALTLVVLFAIALLFSACKTGQQKPPCPAYSSSLTVDQNTTYQKL